MLFGKIFRQDPATASARRLYERIVDQARRPEFYRALGVPDSLDGRFEMVTLHVFLVLHRLKQAGEVGGGALGQALCDIMFADMDMSLREMGAGDLGVGGRIKRMASGFMGRVAAYSAALATGPDELSQALRRNVYGTASVDDLVVAAMADYVRESIELLASKSTQIIADGQPEFAPAAKGGFKP